MLPKFEVGKMKCSVAEAKFKVKYIVGNNDCEHVVFVRKGFKLTESGACFPECVPGTSPQSQIAHYTSDKSGSWL